MKATSLIGGFAFTIFVVILLVSSFSMYQATYGSESSVTVKGYSVEYLSSGVFVNTTLFVKNSGQLPVNLQSSGFGTQLGAGMSGTFHLLVPENMSALSLLGMPLHNLSYFVLISLKMFSYMFSVIKELNLTNITIDALFSSFNATISSGSTSSILTVAFHFLSRIAFPSIAVLENGTNIGSLNLTGNYSQRQSVVVSTSIPAHINRGQELEFQAGSYTWNATCM